MQRRLPSGTSALSARRNELRRRSGQGATSQTPEDEGEAPTMVHSSSQLVSRRVNNLYEDNQNHMMIAEASDIHSLDSRLDVDNHDSSTIKLVSSREVGSGRRFFNTERDNSSIDSISLRVEAPLPPLPEDAAWQTLHQPENEDALSPVILTPRPDGPSRFSSQDSQASKASQRSVFSLFPRLPTPDFTVINSKSLKQAMAAPLDFLRVRTPSIAFVSPSRQPSVDSGLSRHSTTKSSRDLPMQPQTLAPHSSRTQSFGSTGHSIETSSTLCDDNLHSILAETARFHFTRKFPSPASVSSFGSEFTKQNLLEGMVALESGNNLGVESVGVWTGYKWCLLLSVLSVFAYALLGLVYSILTWFGTHRHADVMWVTDNDILTFITLASTLLLLTGLVGLSGALLNSRQILAFYALLLWPSFASVLVVGYTSYKREAFSLDRKLNLAWSQWYDDLGRLLIQESLHCCGFYNPLHEATFSKNCYPRTPLPGCKGELFRFEKDNLRLFWSLAFSLVPLHVLNITVALLCSNHVDRRFGKGLTPRAYRLSMADVRANADAVLAQFSGTKLPSEPSRSLSHVADREDRPATSRMQQGQIYEDIGQNFLRT